MDYALNPYGGCEHGCIYCYAPMHTHTDPAVWRVVRVKRNIVDRLSRELPYVEGIIGIGTVTDPYQGAERRFMLTRRCLEILSRDERSIHIITKSDLVLRDLDLLKDMDCVVGVTVTNVDERASKITEPGAPLPPRRIEALRRLIDSGINAYALVAPVLSTLSGHEQELVDRLKEAGVRTILHDPLNMKLIDPSRMNRMRIGASPSSEAKLSRICRAQGIDDNGDLILDG